MNIDNDQHRKSITQIRHSSHKLDIELADGEIF